MVEGNNEKIMEIRSLARSYFPDCRFTDEETSLETDDKGEVFYRKNEIVPYLQTMFFEEHLVEVQAAQTTRVFFGQVLDEDPNMLEEGEEDEIVDVEQEYEPGSYLKKAESFLLTPLTPAIGNAHIRNAGRIIVRFFSGTIAIELGCSFLEQTMLGENPALRFKFPVIGRVNRGFRNFRAKVSSDTEAKALIRLSSSKQIKEVLTNIVDISVGGLAFEVPEDFADLQIDQSLSLAIKVHSLSELQVNGNVRHITKVRDKKGYITTCGIQFDLESRALAADLENITATVQRLYLREISEKTDDLDGVQLIR